jgi:TRAP-type mannitol/chloroaromatic compound transport system substrate-binding protein
MNNWCWIQVVDDVVKIGLGAIIGGFFAWFVARENNKSTIQRLQFERRSKILSDTAQVLEAHFQAYYKYSNLLCVIEDTTKKTLPEEMVKKLYSDCQNLRLQMYEKMHDNFIAQSQLMLLGEKKCKEKADELITAINNADEQFKFDDKTFDVSRFDEISKTIRRTREAFYEEMEKAFNRN